MAASLKSRLSAKIQSAEKPLSFSGMRLSNTSPEYNTPNFRQANYYTKAEASPEINFSKR